MRQLAQAFSDAYPGQGYLFQDKRFESLWAPYPRPPGVQPWTKAMCPGDFLFKSEGEQGCDQSSGVREFMYQLSDMRKKPGCMYIHHNHWLAHSLGQNLPRDRIITPYIAPHHVEKAVRAAGLNPKTGDISVATTVLCTELINTSSILNHRSHRATGNSHKPASIPARQPLRHLKENLILIDDDVPGNIVQHIQRVAKAHNGSAVLVKGFSKEQLSDLYLKAKVV